MPLGSAKLAMATFGYQSREIGEIARPQVAELQGTVPLRLRPP